MDRNAAASPPPPLKFHIKTLGCKVNWLDSARISAALQSVGHQPVAEEQAADLCLINTCTVTAEADRKSRQTVRNTTAATTAVLGCGPKVEAAAWQQAQPKALIFADEQAIYHHFGIDASALPFPIGSRTRLPIAVQQGCDNRCSFCITRIARGRHHTIAADQVVAQIREAQQHGINEVVLTGVNLAAWGASDSNRAGESQLGALLEQILHDTTIARIRLSSLGPQYLDDHFFALFSDPRLCDYLHISLQSGCDRTLRAMVRDHDNAVMRQVAERARAVRPNVALAADLIAGFPGERVADATATEAFIAAIGFAKLHVFPFSERAGTPAAALSEVVPVAERKRRAAALRELGRELRQHFISAQIGKQQQVLVESRGSGLSSNYIRIWVPQGEEGRLCEVQLTPARIAERWQ